jgi:hypothetical protein
MDNEQFAPSLADIDSLSAIFTALVTGIAPDKLSRTWEEINCGRDICNVASVSHFKLHF